MNFLQAEKDRLHEQAIEQAFSAVLAAPDRPSRHKALDLLDTLVSQRSPAQVLKMEEEQGL